MPGHDEEHKHGAGRHGGKGEGPPEHGKPGHGRPGHDGPPGAGGPGGKPGRRGKKRPDDDEDTEDEDSEEEGGEDDPLDESDEQKHPGVRRAGRVAGRAWKKKHGITKKTKELTEEQKKQIRAVKIAARKEFRRRKA